MFSFDGAVDLVKVKGDAHLCHEPKKVVGGPAPEDINIEVGAAVRSDGKAIAPPAVRARNGNELARE
jgi:hypothetical protein